MIPAVTTVTTPSSATREELIVDGSSPQAVAEDTGEEQEAVHNPLTRSRLGIWLVVLGAVGLAASAGLAIEDYLVLVDPGHVPSCSLSIFITCTNAMESWQGKLLGFPNPFLGVGAFPVVITTGVVLICGLRPPRWYWRAFTAFTTAAAGLIVFLIVATIVSIGRLCPYCMVVWAVMVVLVVQTSAYGFAEHHLPGSARFRRAFVANRSLVVVGLFVVLVASIVIGMWDLVVDQIRLL